MRPPSPDRGSSLPFHWTVHSTNTAGRAVVAARSPALSSRMLRCTRAVGYIPLKLQSCFARGIGDRLHAPVIKKSVAVEHHALDALLDQALGNRLPDRLRAGDIAALGLLPERALDRRLDARRRGDRAAGHVVHDLHVDVGDAPVNREPGTRLGALHAFANPVLDPLAAVLGGFDLHRYAPVFPTFFFSCSPVYRTPFCL